MEISPDNRAATKQALATIMPEFAALPPAARERVVVKLMISVAQERQDAAAPRPSA